MNDVLHANIFFIIASVATVAFALMVCVAMYYIIKILASIRAIVERIEKGSDSIAEDIETMRHFVAGGGLMSYIINLVSSKHRTKRRMSKKAEADDRE